MSTKFTFDEICEAQNFDHNEEFVLASNYEDLEKENQKLNKNAKRWDLLMSCQRIRVLGSANLGGVNQHIGLELWDNYPPHLINPMTEAATKEALTIFVDSIKG